MTLQAAQNDQSRMMAQYGAIMDILSVETSVHFAILDRNFNILTINNCWRNYGEDRGVSSDYEWVGTSYVRPLEKSVQNGDCDALIALNHLCDLQKGIIDEFSFVYPCHDLKSKRWFRCKAKKVEKKPQDLFLICHFDITQEIEMKNELEADNKALEEERCKLEKIEKEMHYGRWSYNAARDELILSRSAQDILGPLGQNQVLRLKDLTNCLAPHHRHLFETKLSRTFHGKAPFHYEDEFHLPHGEKRHFSLSAFPTFTEGKKVDEIYGVLHDVTLEKKTQRHLAHMQKIEILGNLTAEISHNFNNALAVIRGNVEMLRDHCDENTLRFLNRIDRATNQASDLTNKLSRFVSTDRHSFQIFCVGERLLEIVEMGHKLFGDDIELQLDLPSHRVMIETDPFEFDNAILNLMINARDAMDNGGALTIILEDALDLGDPDANVVLRLKDEGSGIEPEKLEKIFEPFFTTKPVGKGSGLGLSAVSSFMQKSAGSISAQSTLGVGSEFILSFPSPKNKTPRLEELQAAQTPKENVCVQATVLLVEDEIDVRSMIAEALVKGGMLVYEAQNSEEAKRLIKGNNRIDLLLTDVVLGPNDKGSDLALWFQEIHPHTPVIFTSGYTNEALSREIIDQKHVHFIAKPFSLDALVKLVAKSVEKTPAASQAQSKPFLGYCMPAPPGKPAKGGKPL